MRDERTVLHVTNVEAALSFYTDRLGFTSPWRYEEDGRARVAQAERQGCALILSDQWPEKAAEGLIFISVNLDPEAQIAAFGCAAHGVRGQGQGHFGQGGFVGLPASGGR